jgi:hypothetical protein
MIESSRAAIAEPEKTRRDGIESMARLEGVFLLSS